MSRGLLRRVALEIRVALETRDVVGDERVRLLTADVLRRADLSPKRLQQIRAAELHVVQDFGHGIAVHEISNLISSAATKPDVHGVRIAKEIVQIAEDFL